MTPVPVQRTFSLHALLPGILVALALLLFGVPQNHALAAVAQAGPSAQDQLEQSHGLLPAQRHLLRAVLADDTPHDDLVEPGVAVVLPQPLVAMPVRAAPHLSLRPVGHRILPPVRGPPAV